MVCNQDRRQGTLVQGLNGQVDNDGVHISGWPAGAGQLGRGQEDHLWLAVQARQDACSLDTGQPIRVREIFTHFSCFAHLSVGTFVGFLPLYLKIWACLATWLSDRLSGFLSSEWVFLIYSQRWASTLANRSNVRHRSNIRAPPKPPPPRCMYPKCGNLCGQRGRKRFIASWGLRMSHICPCTPCPSPQGYRSKVESRHFAHHCTITAFLPVSQPVCLSFLSVVSLLLATRLHVDNTWLPVQWQSSMLLPVC